MSYYAKSTGFDTYEGAMSIFDGKIVVITGGKQGAPYRSIDSVPGDNGRLQGIMRNLFSLG